MSNDSRRSEQPRPSKASSVEQRIDEVLNTFYEEVSKAARSFRNNQTPKRRVVYQSEAKQQLLSLIAEERLDELNHLGYDRRLDNPILSCYNEEDFGAITLEQRQAELQAQIKGVNHE